MTVMKAIRQIWVYSLRAQCVCVCVRVHLTLLRGTKEEEEEEEEDLTGAVKDKTTSSTVFSEEKKNPIHTGSILK